MRAAHASSIGSFSRGHSISDQLAPDTALQVKIARVLPGLLLVAVSLVVIPASTATASSQVAIAAGGQHSCAITAAATVHCWGDNSSGQATDQTDTTYTAIAAGGLHSCAVTAASTVHCWGDNSVGQAPASVTPMTVPGPPTAVAGTAGNAQVALTWTAPANDGGWAISDYQVSVYDGSGGAATGVSGATTRAVGSATTS